MTEEKPLGGSPAGRPTHAGGQQPEGVLILSERDERAVAWLVDQVGAQAVEDACSRLAGRRRAYPSNLAKVLAINLPKSLALTPSDRALEKIAELRARFGWKRQERSR